MKLDSHGYMTLSKKQKAEVDAWLAEQGFHTRETKSYETVGEGDVEVVTLRRNAAGETFLEDGKLAMQRHLIHPSTPPPHFNPSRMRR